MHSYDAGLNVKSGFPVFSTCLEANFILKKEDVYSLYSLTDEDKVSILELARDPRISERNQMGFKGMKYWEGAHWVRFLVMRTTNPTLIPACTLSS